MGPPDMVRLVISDVAIVVVFAQSMPLDEARRLAKQRGLPGEVVLIWLDDEGRMQFLAPPHQQRFLQSLNYDQLRALEQS